MQLAPHDLRAGAAANRVTNAGALILAAVGDVLVDRPDPDGVLEHIAALLRSADLVFGNLEGVLSDVHAAAPGASSPAIAAVHNARPLAAFDVLSLANNHAMDAGYGGLSDTISALSQRGVQTVGAGATLADALAPRIFERGGRRVAVLAATAVLRIGVHARQGTPGVAPLRADDCYSAPFPGMHCPGVPPRVLSILSEGDWELLAQSVAAARERADIVVASVHWGDHTRPWVVTDHEQLCAELLVEAGVDVVLGHHQHMLRGVDFVDGRPVFYGLGHIVFDFPGLADDLRSNGIDADEMTTAELVETFGEFGIFPRDGSPGFPFHPMARMTGVAIVELVAGGGGRCGIVPCLIDGSCVPRPVTRESPEWADLVTFLRTCSSNGRLAGHVLDSGWVHAGFDVVEFAREPVA